MDDSPKTSAPPVVASILKDTDSIGFTMASEPKTGALLATLAASKPKGRLLELGTGTGHGTAWLLSGMCPDSTLDTVDNDPKVMGVAKRHLASDSRVRFHLVDGTSFLAGAEPAFYDLIYADAWVGKFSHLDEALATLKPGGLYVIDDLLPQPSWPEGHGPRIPELLSAIESREGFVSVKLSWASGLMVVARNAA